MPPPTQPLPLSGKLRAEQPPGYSDLQQAPILTHTLTLTLTPTLTLSLTLTQARTQAALDEADRVGTVLQESAVSEAELI